MIGRLQRWMASLALMLRQPIGSFCELETADGAALVTDRGDYRTDVQVLGMRRMQTEAEIVATTEALRTGLASFFDRPGHGLQAVFTCDPERTCAAIDRQLRDTRTIAEAIGLAMESIFAERAHLWPTLMRWEDTTLVLWSRPAVLTHEERRQDAEERAASRRGAPYLRDAQQPWMAGASLAARHQAYVDRVVAALEEQGVSVAVRTPHGALKASRESVYPETAGSAWKAKLPGDDVMPRMPDEIVDKPSWRRRQDVSDLLWPAIEEQLFHEDAETLGARHVRIGAHDWAAVDMAQGPEQPRPFAELLRDLRREAMPYRVSLQVEGGGHSAMKWKGLAARCLAWASEDNRRIRNAVETLTRLREEGDFSVRLRASLATWAPAAADGQRNLLLRRRAAALGSALESWGYCQAGTLAGDPLEGVMGSALGLSMGSTAPVGTPPLAQALRMLPFNRPGSPWESGACLFRTPEGRPYPYDPTGRLRNMVFDLFSGEPGHGKSVLLNSVNLGLILSSAAQGAAGAKLPLVRVADIGVSGKGLIDLVHAALPARRRHEAAYIRYENRPEFSVNPFDTQVGCRHPLPLERSFLQNLLSLGCTPIGEDAPHEGMDQLIGAVITEVYRVCSDAGDNKTPKRYLPGLVPEADAALARHRVRLHPDARWWDVVDALCDCGEHRLAGLAQRHAVPLLEDLMTAVRAPAIAHLYSKPRARTAETLIELFERYVTALIDWLPNISQPTAFDTGEARVIVLDLEDVAPAGSPRDDRQAEIMYLMGRHILGRDMFLRPGYVRHVPERVRAYHRKRFSEVKETIKRLCYDEFHRAGRRPRIVAQVQIDRREGRKHNLHVALCSQMQVDFPPELVQQATGIFLLGAGNEDANLEAARRFNLSPAGAQVVRHRLKGPGKKGEGAPFLAVFSLRAGARVEQMLYNSLGSVELWALSTRPADVALRDRLYAALGAAETWQRLSRVFPLGTAEEEVDRRRDELVRGGEEEGQAQASVVEGLARELIDGTGLGIVLRPAEVVALPRRPAPGAERMAAE